MLNNPWIFILLLCAGLAGVGMGAFYYFFPQKVVIRRIKKHHWDSAKHDVEFRKWLDNEMKVQIKRTQKMGMMFIIVETIWLVMILGFWQKFF